MVVDLVIHYQAHMGLHQFHSPVMALHPAAVMDLHPVAAMEHRLLHESSVRNANRRLQI